MKTDTARARLHIQCSKCWRTWAYDIDITTNLALQLANQGWWPEQQICPGCMIPKEGEIV